MKKIKQYRTNFHDVHLAHFQVKLVTEVKGSYTAIEGPMISLHGVEGFFEKSTASLQLCCNDLGPGPIDGVGFLTMQWGGSTSVTNMNWKCVRAC